MTNHLEEAVEAAAASLVSLDHVDDWSLGFEAELDELDSFGQQQARAAAREVLNAALPHIEKHVREHTRLTEDGSLDKDELVEMREMLEWFRRTR